MKRFFKQLALFAGLFFCCQIALASIQIQNQITGINKTLLKNANARLTIMQKSHLKKLGKKKAYQLLEKGVKEIQLALEPYGYFKSTVNARLTHEKNIWLFNYHVCFGPQIAITSFSLQLIGDGKNNAHIQKAIKKFPLKEGDPFDSTQYEKAKDYLLNVAQKQGYLDAKLSKNIIKINLANYFCSIKMKLDTGQRYYFGHVTFSKTPFVESFLRRYMTFKIGQPFSFQRLLHFQQHLSGSNYFKSVSAIPNRKNKANKNIPVHVNFEMNKKREYKFGVGYGTNTGMRGTIGYSMRWLNKYGHKLNTIMRLSKIQQNVSAQYLIPGSHPATDQYAITASYLHQKPKRGESTMKSIGIAHIRNFTKWQRTIGINYEIEKYKIEKNEAYHGSKLLMPNLTFTRIHTKNVLNVKNGSRFNLSLKGASTDVISTVSFIQTQLTYKLIHTLWRDNRFVFRADYGYTIVHDITKLPLSKRFYAGGIQSVRGYGDQSLGPGRYLLTGSAEYQRRVVGNWYAAVFYDIGNAMDHFNTSLKRSAGVGVVWQSPIGAIQLYVARTLSHDGNPIRVEFSLGPDL